MNQQKTIDTLVKDIDELFNEPVELDDDLVEQLGRRVAEVVRDRLSHRRGAPTLRVSNLGTPCHRKLWYGINQSELAEPLSPAARRKFLYGDILEELYLFFCKAAGHDVRDEQREVDLYGVKGHIDAIIDDHLVDLKSASSFSFDKFQAGLNDATDGFGYRTQLGSYAHALGRTEGAFLAIDKVTGNIHLDKHVFPEVDYKKKVAHAQAMLEDKDPPPKAYFDEPDGASGNKKLGVACSYCDFKHSCWPGLRTFLYSGRPRFLTKVARRPQDHIREV